MHMHMDMRIQGHFYTHSVADKKPLTVSVCSAFATHVHPVRNPRFASFRTQPFENLSAAVELPIKTRFLGNPTLGTNLG